MAFWLLSSEAEISREYASGGATLSTAREKSTWRKNLTKKRHFGRVFTKKNLIFAIGLAPLVCAVIVAQNDQKCPIFFSNQILSMLRWHHLPYEVQAKFRMARKKGQNSTRRNFCVRGFAGGATLTGGTIEYISYARNTYVSRIRKWHPQKDQQRTKIPNFG